MLETQLIQPTTTRGTASPHSRNGSTKDTEASQSDFETEYASHSDKGTQEPEATPQPAAKAEPQQEPETGTVAEDTVEAEVVSPAVAEPDFVEARPVSPPGIGKRSTQQNNAMPPSSTVLLSSDKAPLPGNSAAFKTVAQNQNDSAADHSAAKQFSAEKTDGATQLTPPGKTISEAARTVAADIGAQKDARSQSVLEPRKEVTALNVRAPEARMRAGQSEPMTQPTVSAQGRVFADAQISIAQEESKTERKFEALRQAKSSGDFPLIERSTHAKTGTGSAMATPPAAALASQTAMQLKTAGKSDSKDWLYPAGLQTEMSGTWEPRTTAPGQSVALAQIMSRAETPGLIGRQMAEAMQRHPDKPVELALNPRELGRVRMSISASEAGITVNVLAERTETLDLMRRNIGELSREFQAIGYESISFAFSEGHTSDHASSDRSGQNAVFALELEYDPESAPPDVATRQTITSGLDIRL